MAEQKSDLSRAFSEDGALKTHVGGQALIEGIMMRGKYNWSVAVREPDGGIYVEEHDLASGRKKNGWMYWPLVRGCRAMLESLVLGYKALEIAALHAFAEEGEDEPAAGAGGGGGGRGPGRAAGGCEGVSRMLLSFGRFLKVSQDSFGVPDTAGTRRRLLRQLPYLRGKAFLGYFKKLLQNFISIRDTPSQPPPALQSPLPNAPTGYQDSRPPGTAPAGRTRTGV